MARVTLGARVAEMEKRLTEALADVLHPFATEHRYELAGRLRHLEDELKVSREREAGLLRQIETLVGRIELVMRRLDDDGEGWKRGWNG